MDPVTFMKTIYLHDRACKKIILDGWNHKVMLQADFISRIRDPSGLWNYYTAEDIEDGLIVFQDVSFFAMEPPGLIPNDFILDAEVKPLPEKGASGNPSYLFIFQVGYGDQWTRRTAKVTVKIEASEVHLEDPARPGIAITE